MILLNIFLLIRDGVERYQGGDFEWTQLAQSSTPCALGTGIVHDADEVHRGTGEGVDVAKRLSFTRDHFGR